MKFSEAILNDLIRRLVNCERLELTIGHSHTGAYVFKDKRGIFVECYDPEKRDHVSSPARTMADALDLALKNDANELREYGYEFYNRPRPLERHVPDWPDNNAERCRVRDEVGMTSEFDGEPR